MSELWAGCPNLGHAIGQWKARSNTRLVAKVQHRLQQLRQVATVDIHWIKAHCGNAYNERADKLAKVAADGLEQFYE